MINKDSERIIQNISTNIKFYLGKSGLNMSELAEKLGISRSTVSLWCKGKSIPRMDKVDMMCSIFNCERIDLIEDQETAARRRKQERDAILEYLFRNDPDRKMLFSVSEDAVAEDIRQAVNLIQFLNEQRKKNKQ